MRKITIAMEELMPLLTLQMETAGSASLTVTGWSMMPMLHNRRDTVVIAPVKGQRKKGELILYQRENGKFVLHRILRARNGGYVCCGDNQFFTEKVEHSQLLAVVTRFTRGGKSYSVEDKGYRRYVWWWVNLHPLRWLYLVPRRLLGYIRTAIRHRRRVP